MAWRNSSSSRSRERDELAERASRSAVTSGLALLGHWAGDRVEVRTLLGIQVVTILAVL
jgi:hypothetical protein